MGKTIDLTGQRFGDLVAIEPTNSRNKRGHVIWLCYCDCGNDHFVSSGNLNPGGGYRGIKSCGHSEDLTGQIFNNLRVLECVGKKDTSLLWLCICLKDNNFIIAKATRLKNGHIKSCGCLQTRAGGQSCNKNYIKARRYEITLDQYEQMLFDQDWCCKLCGINESDLLEITGQCLEIDHDHITGKVRGILCHSCNTGVGQYEKMKKLNVDQYLNTN